MGMGLNFRLLKLNSNFRHLAKAELLEAYRLSQRRLIFLDYEGTLQAVESVDDTTDDLKPQTRLLKLLTALSNDSKNLIFIVTGRQKNILDSWFGCKKVF
jgi:trehalose 6-phosphate synthase/phosphatase